MSFIVQDRPLAIFDIEATGLNPRTDRIVELAVIRIPVKGETQRKTWLINPTVPIPIETIAIHGITDADVAECPTFAQLADEIFNYFRGCDLGGFGMGRFDIPMLEEKFARVVREIQVGTSRKNALLAMSRRIDLPDMKSFVNSLVQADELGVSIGAILRIQSEQIRTRRFERAEKLANEAPVKLLAPLMIFIFPSVFLILLGPVIYRLITQM